MGGSKPSRHAAPRWAGVTRDLRPFLPPQWACQVGIPLHPRFARPYPKESCGGVRLYGRRSHDRVDGVLPHDAGSEAEIGESLRPELGLQKKGGFSRGKSV